MADIRNHNKIATELNAATNIVAEDSDSSELLVTNSTQEVNRVNGLALKAISLGVMISGTDGLIISANPAFTAISGYREDEILGRNCKCLQGPLTDTHTIEAMRVARQNRTEFSGEILNYRKNGTTYWNDLTITPIFDEIGELTHFVGVTRDITEQKLSEALLHLQNEQLTMIATGESMKDSLTSLALGIEAYLGDGLCSILLLDKDGLHLNHGAAPNLPEEYCLAIDGVTIGESVGSCGTAAFRREPVIVEDIAADPLWTDFKEAALSHGLRSCWSTPIMSAEQRVLGTFAIYRREPGRPSLQHLKLISLATNIAVIAINKQQTIEALKSSENKLRMIFETMSEGVALNEIIYDQNGEMVDYRILEVNNAFYGIADFSNQEVVGNVATKLYGMSAETIKTFWEKNRISNEVQHTEMASPLKNKWFNVCTSPFVNNRFVTSFFDITESKKGVEEQTRLQAQLYQSQKMESVGLLAGGVAHDFNNMLGVILGHTEFAIEQMDPSEHLYQDLLAIRTAAERSADLTRQLLAYARKQAIEPEVLNLNEIVVDMLAMLNRLIGEEIHVVWHPEQQLWMIKVDKSQINQILTNLCLNARSAIKDVGTITIQTANSILNKQFCSTHQGSEPGEYVLLTVTDMGSGMSKETLSRIFEPFFTTKGLGEGTGLGLAMVYGAVKQNRGFITVWSELGIGTTFDVYLPRFVDNEIPQPFNPKISGRQSGNETILVVEDEAAILDIISRVLTQQGYTVLSTNSPADSILLAQAYPKEIHLLLTDVVMPEMNGKDLANILILSNPDMKCLYMSGYTADIIADRGVLDDGVHFIQKPFTMSNLTVKIRSVLDTVIEL